ncbi:ABC-F family ATP-binding cassette domain-containing protein [Ruania zhangjianzhongii]|uniref:ABC-F family ATP-binding cassette domain-containing protein n=1 Tax=Ruania zhangjianzhongii TaxID=2603206 RepID=UPI001AEF3E0D|nr:ABC-F family ATP-binding cassette domain-containing protein [Ruania zhangjianzhongii]
MTTSTTPLSAAHLRLDGISRTFGTRRVLTDVSLVVPAGRRAGLIGENGSGKTTLLRIAAGRLHPDAGTVSVSAPGGRTPRAGLLHQEVPFEPSDTVTDALEAAIAPSRRAAAAVDSAGVAMAEAPQDEAAARDFATALESAERLDAWNASSRMEMMLSGLGLADLPRDRTTGALSGGQRSRLALAWLLLSAPDVLLLDEPTNHLDDAAAEYLQQVLTSWSGPVLLASHDRAFLDETVTSLVDLDPAPLPQAVAGQLVGDGDGSGIGAVSFTGSYTDYLHARMDARQRWERQYVTEQEELKRLRAAVRDSHTVGHAGREPRTEARAAKKFYADRNAKVVSRRVNDARTRLAELDEAQLRKPPQELWFRGLTAGTAGQGRSRRNWSGPVLTATQVSLPGRLSQTSLSVAAGEKWLITGPNGVGKSTLLHLLAADLAPATGSVHTPAALRIGLLTQEVHLPDPERRGSGRTARQVYADLVGAGRAERVPLSTFALLPGRDENRPVEVLSVGQRRRLALAVLLADPPDVLLLDEPTNHLSLVLVTQLEDAIGDYPGAVVVASHDRWLRRFWTHQRLDLRSQAS